MKIEEKDESSIAPRVWRRSAAIKKLGGTVFRDAIKAGWLAPCVVKKSAIERRSNASIFFRLSDIEEVERRLLAGEYPNQPSATEPVLACIYCGQPVPAHSMIKLPSGGALHWECFAEMSNSKRTEQKSE